MEIISHHVDFTLIKLLDFKNRSLQSRITKLYSFLKIDVISEQLPYTHQNTSFAKLCTASHKKKGTEKTEKFNARWEKWEGAVLLVKFYDCSFVLIVRIFWDYWRFILSWSNLLWISCKNFLLWYLSDNSVVRECLMKFSIIKFDKCEERE